MRRHLFTLLSAVSLVLCVATVVLWVRSFESQETLQHEAHSGDERLALMDAWAVTSSRGGILFRHVVWFVHNNPLGPAALASPCGWSFLPPSRAEAFPEILTTQPFGIERWGIGWGRWEYTDWPPPGSKWGWTTQRVDDLVVPHALVVVVLLLLSTPGVLVAVRQGRRRRTGLCPACGYDLRASPDRCPECGAAPKRVP